MSKNKFPQGTLVLIKLGTSPDQILEVTVGIVSGGTGDKRIVRQKGGRERRVSLQDMIPIAELSQEDCQRDPAELLDEQKDLSEEFWKLFGEALLECFIPTM